MSSPLAVVLRGVVDRIAELGEKRKSIANQTIGVANIEIIRGSEVFDVTISVVKRPQ